MFFACLYSPNVFNCVSNLVIVRIAHGDGKKKHRASGSERRILSDVSDIVSRTAALGQHLNRTVVNRKTATTSLGNSIYNVSNGLVVS